MQTTAKQTGQNSFQASTGLRSVRHAHRSERGGAQGPGTHRRRLTPTAGTRVAQTACPQSKTQRDKPRQPQNHSAGRSQRAEKGGAGRGRRQAAPADKARCQEGPLAGGRAAFRRRRQRRHSGLRKTERKHISIIWRTKRGNKIHKNERSLRNGCRKLWERIKRGRKAGKQRGRGPDGSGRCVRSGARSGARGTGDVPAGPDPPAAALSPRFETPARQTAAAEAFNVLWPRFLWIFAALEVTGSPALPSQWAL